MENSTLEFLIKKIKSDKKEDILHHIRLLADENRCFLDISCSNCSRRDNCTDNDNSDIEYVRKNIDELLFLRKMEVRNKNECS